jgi:hypothetical protein
LRPPFESIQHAEHPQIGVAICPLAKSDGKDSNHEIEQEETEGTEAFAFSDPEISLLTPLSSFKWNSSFLQTVSRQDFVQG